VQLLAALWWGRLRRVRLVPDAWVIVDSRGVHRVERGRSLTLVDFGEPVGVSVFASVGRQFLQVALTSARATRYVGAVVVDASDAVKAREIIERALTAADEDLRGAERRPLTAGDAQRLVDAIALWSPGATDRAVLSDTAGQAVVLERSELRVGPHRIDLCAPLEWRGFLFQEAGACAVSVCQATWVRQADVELVLVAALSPGGAQERQTHAAVRAAGEAPLVRRAIARDARLMQVPIDDPPPRELRRAIDRLFMLPLRRALDRAPRAGRSSSPSIRSHVSSGQSERRG
jgi:hypothetical protein